MSPRKAAKKSQPVDSGNDKGNNSTPSGNDKGNNSTPKKESDIEVKNESDEYDEEDEIILRAKWCLDGASTIDEAIAKLNGFIRYLNQLKVSKIYYHYY